MHLLFVYGTLRRNERNVRHPLLAGAAFEGAAVARGRLLDLGAYPGFIEGDGPVAGELWAVREDALRRLDEYEGDEYRRIRLPVRADAGEREAWAYLYVGPREGRPEVADGDWRRHVSARRSSSA